MRKLNRYAFMTFAVFAGMASLTACSSSDDAGQEPTVNPGEAVKTSFTLSVGLPQGNRNGAKPATRVSEAVAQAQSPAQFRGIDNITLIPFGLAGSTGVDAPIQSSSSRLGSNIALPGTNGSANNAFVAPTNGINNNVYTDVSLPQGTTAFLFYGKAIDDNVNTAITTDAQKHQYGSLTAAGLEETNPSSITFTPVQVDNLTAAPAKATTIAQYLTTIANTNITVTSGTTNTVVNWSDADNDNNPEYRLYTQFIQTKNGSSNDVRIVMQNLYDGLKNVSNPMAQAIIANIRNHATISDAGVVTLDDQVSGYPDAANPIPEGVCLVSWNGDSKSFTPNISGTNDNGELTTPPSDLVYPANLQYYVNTNIQTSNADRSNVPTSTSDWTSVLSSYEDGSQVSPSTRAVALKKQIQYAVGRLDLTLSESASTLNDHNGDAVPGVDANGNSNFPISAIFVGGQRQVGFDFTPVANAHQYTIYDNVGPDNWAAAPANTTAAVMHTLALETPASEKVRVAVELTNNSGKDFVGAGGGIIYNGAKFYLIAELDPAATSTTQPSTGSQINQVFKQDYVTKANLHINAAGGQNSGLGNAYNILPDLRNPKLSLGLSVDLTWQSGLTFDVTM